LSLLLLFVLLLFCVVRYPTGAPVASNGFAPSAALMKAVLIGGADSLSFVDANEVCRCGCALTS